MTKKYTIDDIERCFPLRRRTIENYNELQKETMDADLFIMKDGKLFYSWWNSKYHGSRFIVNRLTYLWELNKKTMKYFEEIPKEVIFHLLKDEFNEE